LALAYKVAVLLLLLLLLLLLQVLCLRLQSASGFEDEMVVAFRGTETDSQGAASDILTDIYALQVRRMLWAAGTAVQVADTCIHLQMLTTFTRCR
jgi:hypothetical protein